MTDLSSRANEAIIKSSLRGSRGTLTRGLREKDRSDNLT